MNSTCKKTVLALGITLSMFNTNILPILAQSSSDSTDGIIPYCICSKPPSSLADPWSYPPEVGQEIATVYRPPSEDYPNGCYFFEPPGCPEPKQQPEQNFPDPYLPLPKPSW